MQSSSKSHADWAWRPRTRKIIAWSPNTLRDVRVQQAGEGARREGVRQSARHPIVAPDVDRRAQEGEGGNDPRDTAGDKGPTAGTAEGDS